MQALNWKLMPKALVATALVTFGLSNALFAAPRQNQTTVPSEQVQALLIYETMAALHNAHVTGNYTVLRDLAAPEFAAVNSAAHLAEIFAAQRKAQLNLGPILLYQPVLQRPASIDSDGRLTMAGFFDTKPVRINFDLKFLWAASTWRAFAINVTPTRAEER